MYVFNYEISAHFMKQKLRRLGMAVLLMVAAMTMYAEDYGKYYQQLPVAVKQAEVAQIPSKTVALTDFGAVGDGRTLCTDAFKKAISTLKNQGGGRLVVPAGVWLTGPIELESNIEMRLDHEAIIYFSPDKRLYLPDETNKTKWGGSRVLPCIYASKKHDIAITGSGIIDGNGQQWRPVKRSKVSDTEWYYIKQMGGIERPQCCAYLHGGRDTLGTRLPRHTYQECGMPRCSDGYQSRRNIGSELYSRHRHQ